MVELNGHEAGNGGHSQGRPTAHRDLLYSERWGYFNNNLFVVATTPRLTLTCPRILPNIPRLHDWLNRPSLPYRSMKLVRMLARLSLPWSISTQTLKRLIRLR